MSTAMTKVELKSETQFPRKVNLHRTIWGTLIVGMSALRSLRLIL